MSRPDQDEPARVGSALDSSAGTPEEAVLPDSRQDALTALPIIEEQAHVAKREIVTGKIRVRTVVEAREQLVREELDTEHVTVTRVPVDRQIETAPSIRTEGDLTIIPVLEEVLVVEKKLVLREEIHIRRTSTTELVEQPVSLRKQAAVIEHLSADDTDE